MLFILEITSHGGHVDRQSVTNHELADRLEALAQSIRHGLTEIEGSIVIAQPPMQHSIRFMGNQRFQSDGWLRF